MVFNLLRFGGFREHVGVEGVVGVGDDDRDVQLAHGPLLDALGDAAREVGEEVGGGVKGFEGPAGKADGGEGGFGAGVGAGGVRHLQHGARRYVLPIHRCVELPDEVRVGVGLLGGQFEDGLVVERGLAGFAEPGAAQGLQARQVIGGDGVGGIRWSRQEQPLSGGWVQFAADRQALLPLEGAQGGAGLRAYHAVEGPGGNAQPGQRQLSLEDALDGAGKCSGRRGRGDGGRGARAEARWEVALVFAQLAEPVWVVRRLAAAAQERGRASVLARAARRAGTATKATRLPSLPPAPAATESRWASPSARQADGI